MKKLLTVLVLSFIVQKGFSQQKNLKDLLGVWEVFGVRENNATLQVIDSSTIILTYNDERKKIKDYKIDFSRSPIWFDFTTEADSSIIAVKSLVEIINKNLIKWQLFVDDARTPYFSSSKGELFYLRKKSTEEATSATVASN